MTLAELNRLTRPLFEMELGGIFEHSPWVAADAYRARPFADRDSVHAAMMEAVLLASPEKQLALIRAHPELAGAEAKAGTLTAHSSGEQADGLTRVFLSPENRAANELVLGWMREAGMRAQVDAIGNVAGRYEA